MTLADLIKSHETQGLVLAGMSTIAKLTKTTTDDTAVGFLVAVRGVMSIIEAGATGQATIDECKASLAAFEGRIESNDARADAVAAAKPHRTDG